MDNITYINILIQTLSKKDQLLDRLIEITHMQKDYLSVEDLNMEQFDQTLPEKELIIENLNQLDEGFEKVYDHVKNEIGNNLLQFKQEILLLKELVKQVTEKSVNLQALEMKNKNKLEDYLSKKKKEIKEYKMNSQTASNYYKNVVNQQVGQSFFLDKKK